MRKFSIVTLFLSCVIFFGGGDISYSFEQDSISAVRSSVTLDIKSNLKNIRNLAADPGGPEIYEIGRGFNAITGTWAGSCFNDDVTKTANSVRPNLPSDIRSEVVFHSSFSQLQEQMGLNVYAKANYGDFSGSANYRSMRDILATTNSLLGSVDVGAISKGTSFRFKFDDLMEARKSSYFNSDFIASCGTHFVGAIERGALLRFLVRLDDLSTSERYSITSAIGAKYAGFTGNSAEIGTSSYKFSNLVYKETKARFNLAQIGGLNFCGRISKLPSTESAQVSQIKFAADAALEKAGKASQQESEDILVKITSPNELSGAKRIELANECGRQMVDSILAQLDVNNPASRYAQLGCHNNDQSRSTVSEQECQIWRFGGMAPITYVLVPYFDLRTNESADAIDFAIHQIERQVQYAQAIDMVNASIEFQEVWEPRFTAQEIRDLDLLKQGYLQGIERAKKLTSCAALNWRNVDLCNASMEERNNFDFSALRQILHHNRNEWIDVKPHLTAGPVFESWLFLGEVPVGQQATIRLRGRFAFKHSKTGETKVDWTNEWGDLFSKWCISDASVRERSYANCNYLLITDGKSTEFPYETAYPDTNGKTIAAPVILRMKEYQRQSVGFQANSDRNYQLEAFAQPYYDCRKTLSGRIYVYGPQVVLKLLPDSLPDLQVRATYYDDDIYVACPNK